MSLPSYKEVPVCKRHSLKGLYSVIAEEYDLTDWNSLDVSVRRSKRKVYDYLASELNLVSWYELDIPLRRSTRLLYNFIVVCADPSTPTLTVIVNGTDGALSGATVVIGEESETTDSDGKASFDLEYGDYEATISASGYVTATETLAFRSNHKNFTVTLEASGGSDDLVLTWDSSKASTISILTENPMTQESIDGLIFSDGATATIDWGDGSTPTEWSGPSSFNHTYEDDDEYTVTVSVSDGALTGMEWAFFDVGVMQEPPAPTGALLSVELPSGVTTIGDACFYGCTGLTSMELPSGVTTIGDACFSRCTGLTSMELPSGVTTIGDACFSRCTGLTSMELPSGVTTIGDACFSRCTGLTSMELPSGVTTIGGGCFSRCTGLTSVSIPASVTLTENNYIFDGDDDYSAMETLDLYWTGNAIPPIQYFSFDNLGTMTNATINIPTGTTSDYTAKDYPSEQLQERT